MAEVGLDIDTDSCIASATCASIAPALFVISDEGDHAVALQATLTEPELIALAEEAERSCPTAAIIVQRA